MRRLAVTSHMDDQLDRALVGTDEITHRRTQELAVHAAETIDHLLWRLCQAVVTLAVLATIGWGLRRRSARLAVPGGVCGL